MKTLVAAAAAPAPAPLFFVSYARHPVGVASAGRVDGSESIALFRQAMADFDRAERRWQEIEDNRTLFGVSEVCRRYGELELARERYEIVVHVLSPNTTCTDAPSTPVPDDAAASWSAGRDPIIHVPAGPEHGASVVLGGVQSTAGRPGRLIRPATDPGPLTPPGRQPPSRSVDRDAPNDARIAQHAADTELVRRLAAVGFSGPEYDQLIAGLARYGLAAVGRWIRSGEIFGRCAERGIRGLPPIPAAWGREDVEDLTQDTVARGIVDFERRLRDGGWHPAGGASLATYFMGGTLFAFADTYRRRYSGWQNEHRLHLAIATQPRTDLGDIADPIADDHALLVFLKSTAPDPRLRMVIYLAIEGFTHAQIAQRLADGTTPRAVEAMLYRYRQQARPGRGGENR